MLDAKARAEEEAAGGSGKPKRRATAATAATATAATSDDDNDKAGDKADTAAGGGALPAAAASFHFTAAQVADRLHEVYSATKMPPAKRLDAFMECFGPSAMVSRWEPPLRRAGPQQSAVAKSPDELRAMMEARMGE